MSVEQAPRRERLGDLLAARATEGLEPAEWPELEELLAEQDEYGWDDFDRAAAALDCAFAAGRAQPMPSEVRRLVEARAAEFRAHATRRPAPVLRGPGSAGPARLGWIVAAAAALLAAFAWIGREGGTASAPPAERRSRLLAEADDVVQAPWQGLVAPYEEVRGDVVWSAGRQEGYLRLAGMPANDPSRRQYQLWIVAPARDEEPVDGGVFDVLPGRDEVVVPIRAKLRVTDPQAFVITSEQPGGVVVSQGPHLALAR